MKKVIYASIVAAMILCACKKDPRAIPPHILNGITPDYIATVEKFVRQHPAFVNYDSIDFDRYRVSQQKAHWYLRLPLKNKCIATDFILLQTDSLGTTSDGKIIHLEKAVNAIAGSGTAVINHSNYNGSIDIRSLDQTTVLHSAITGGYIELWHPALFAANQNTKNRNAAINNKAESFPVPIDYDELPEVVIIGYGGTNNADGGLSLADYMMLQSMFGGSGTGGGESSGGGGGSSSGGTGATANAIAAGGYGVYSSIDYGAGAGIYATGTNSPTTPPQVDADVTLTFDDSYSRPAIDLNAWMKCFANIPDVGATSTVTLYGDLPADDNPNVGINFWNGNTGHCFLQLSKTNGAQSVTQIIGFTAQSAGKAVLMPYAYIPSKIVDNAGHKYNCSITMHLGAAGLNTVIAAIQALAGKPYSIVNYDCLDFALAVINAVRPANPLLISKVPNANDPFADIATGPKLYVLLQQMVAAGSPEAGDITVGGSKYIGLSHGPCN